MNEDNYQKLTPRERLEVLDEASRRLGMAPAILEKDYWVCRTLGMIFSLPELSEHLLFKGGTSLSKVYRLIDRFSEDVDVSFHREYLGFGPDHDPEAAEGKEQRRRLDALQAACATCIREVLLPALRSALENSLAGEDKWSIEVDETDSQTLLFRFPQAGVVALPYIAPMVRIEMGARSDHWPKERHSIRSFIGEALDQPIGDATVEALSAERTFWEKATLLHAECHRDPAKPMPARYARHYHDLARLAASGVTESALADVDLRRRVVSHKSVYFRSAWAHYDLAVPATFKLVPSAQRIDELRKDHESMQQMFFSPPPPLDHVLATLSELESRIRTLAD